MPDMRDTLLVVSLLATAWFCCLVVYVLVGIDSGKRWQWNFGRLTRTTFCVLAAAMMFATFKGGAKLRSPNGEATSWELLQIVENGSRQTAVFYNLQ